MAADVDRVRAAEVIAALSLATDLGIGVPLEYGLESTLYATRLADRLGVDAETASHTYCACLLFYVGCTAGAETAAELFGDERTLMTYAGPARPLGQPPAPCHSRDDSGRYWARTSDLLLVEQALSQLS